MPEKFEQLNVLETLRQEIAEMKRVEMEKKEKDVKEIRGEGYWRVYDHHFDNIDSANLTQEDLEIFRKLKEGVLTRAELVEHKNSLENNSHDSRTNFIAWLSNKSRYTEDGKRLIFIGEKK